MNIKTFIIPFFVLYAASIFSCNTNPKKKYFNDFKKYYLIVTYKSKNDFRSDSIFIWEKTDSAAFLLAKEKYDGHKNDYILAKKLGFEEPISFKLLNDNKDDIKIKLSPQTLFAIDSLSAINLDRIRYAKYDSLGNIRNYDSNRNGLLHILDSIIKNKKKGTQSSPAQEPEIKII